MITIRIEKRWWVKPSLSLLPWMLVPLMFVTRVDQVDRIADCVARFIVRHGIRMTRSAP